MKIKNLFIIAMASLLVISTPLVANAETQSLSTAGNMTITVTTTVLDTFTVTAPKNIAAAENATTKEDIIVSGDIAGDKKIVLEVPNTMELSTTGKDPVDVNLSLSKTDFIYSDISVPGGCKSILSVIVPDLSSGEWAGEFELTIDVEDYAG